MSNELGSLELIRKINKSLVLNTVKKYQPISRAEIARKLKLSKTTVVAIVDDFVERKLLFELKEEDQNDKRVGRPGIMLGFNPKSAYGIGIDIGGTKTLLVITDLDGEVAYIEKIPTTNQISEIIDLIKTSITKSGVPEEKIIGMGIGIPGTIKDNTVRLAKSLDWHEYDLIADLKPFFPFPIFINNDVRFACMGERWIGSGNRSDNIFFIAIGTGIGSAIVNAGHLIEGHQNKAGEICYFIGKDDIDRNLFNIEGKYAVFENKVSGTALNQFNYPSEDLFKRYKSGDPLIDKIVQGFITNLSIAIANAVSLLNPEYVILGGGVSESLAIVVDEIQELVNQITPIKTQVKLASLGERAGAIGAVASTFEHIEQY